MATIEDVARLACVSKGTVSSVFSKKRPISAEVTERVLKVAKDLGYFPNHLARSLSIKKTMIIGLKMPISTESVLSGFENQMINGVIQECSKQGYRVLLDTLPEQEDLTQSTIDPVDGVILLNPRKDDPRIKRYKRMGIPLVLVGRPDPIDETISYVDNDNEHLGLEIGEFLLKNGHTSILFLNASSDMTVAYDREKGLSEAFRRHGESFDNVRVTNFDRMLHYSPTEYGYISLRNYYGQADFTAIIADTDRVALGILRAARESGIDIPEELSIIALSNDAILAQETTPKLTSVELSAEMLGIEAAKILIEKMKNTAAVYQRMIATDLIIRDSCKVLS